MRVYLTGGTGFVGPAIVRELLRRGHEATLLVHRSRGTFRGDEPALRFVEGGDVTDFATLRGMEGHDAVIHLVALRRGTAREYERMHTQATRNVVEAARAAKVPRFVYMSAEGVDHQRTPYEVTKVAAENLVRGSGLAWTIFRPNFMTGPAEGDAGGFDHEFAALAQRMPVLPNFDGGRFKMRPIAKADVARAVVLALEKPVARNKLYPLGGPTVMTWSEYLHALGEAMGKKLWLAPAPTWLVLPVASLLGGFDWFPASADELRLLVEDHVEDSSLAMAELGLTLSPWKPALREAVQHMPRAPSDRREWGGRPREPPSARRAG